MNHHRYFHYPKFVVIVDESNQLLINLKLVLSSEPPMVAHHYVSIDRISEEKYPVLVVLSLVFRLSTRRHKPRHLEHVRDSLFPGWMFDLVESSTSLLSLALEILHHGHDVVEEDEQVDADDDGGHVQPPVTELVSQDWVADVVREEEHGERERDEGTLVPKVDKVVQLVDHGPFRREKGNDEHVEEVKKRDLQHD